MKTFKKYSSIENAYRDKFMLDVRMTITKDTQFVVTEKAHGCLDGDTMIMTREFGEVPINYIVDNQINCHVLSYNIETNEKEWDEVTNFQNVVNDDKEWYELELDDGTVVKITGNHKIWIEDMKEYVSVDDLIGKNDVFVLIQQICVC